MADNARSSVVARAELDAVIAKVTPTAATRAHRPAVGDRCSRARRGDDVAATALASRATTFGVVGAGHAVSNDPFDCADTGDLGVVASSSESSHSVHDTLAFSPPKALSDTLATL